MKIMHTFLELGKAYGLTPKKSREKDFHCRKCGGVMRHIPQTNVFLCENKNEEGGVCGHRVFTAKAF